MTENVRFLVSDPDWQDHKSEAIGRGPQPGPVIIRTIRSVGFTCECLRSWRGYFKGMAIGDFVVEAGVEPGPRQLRAKCPGCGRIGTADRPPEP
jgi:hypothetical protein